VLVLVCAQKPELDLVSNPYHLVGNTSFKT
jgi:hypothetical protein